MPLFYVQSHQRRYATDTAHGGPGKEEKCHTLPDNAFRRRARSMRVAADTHFDNCILYVRNMLSYAVRTVIMKPVQQMLGGAAWRINQM